MHYKLNYLAILLMQSLAGPLHAMILPPPNDFKVPLVTAPSIKDSRADASLVVSKVNANTPAANAKPNKAFVVFFIIIDLWDLFFSKRIQN